MKKKHLGRYEKQYSFYNHSIYTKFSRIHQDNRKVSLGGGPFVPRCELGQKKVILKESFFLRNLGHETDRENISVFQEHISWSNESMRKAPTSLQICAFLVTTGYSTRNTVPLEVWLSVEVPHGGPISWDVSLHLHILVRNAAFSRLQPPTSRTTAG